jgi:HSP20 family molecular chaperone IbpA
MGSLSSEVSMWSRACALIEEAERRHRRFFDLRVAASRPPAWEPPVDIYVLERELQVVVALPGVSPDAIGVELTPAGLWVRAENRLPAVANAARILRIEIPYGRIERRIELPPARYEPLNQEFVNGCLRIRLAAQWL